MGFDGRSRIWPFPSLLPADKMGRFLTYNIKGVWHVAMRRFNI